MAKLVFGMMQSLDGYVAGAAGGPQLPRPGDQLHRHFNDVVGELTGSIYGRRMYEVMRYWDDDQPDWDSVKRDFAAAWRAKAGKPYFSGPRPPLRLLGTESVGEDAVTLTYAAST